MQVLTSVSVRVASISSGIRSRLALLRESAESDLPLSRTGRYQWQRAARAHTAKDFRALIRALRRGLDAELQACGLRLRALPGVSGWDDLAQMTPEQAQTALADSKLAAGRGALLLLYRYCLYCGSITTAFEFRRALARACEQRVRSENATLDPFDLIALLDPDLVPLEQQRELLNSTGVIERTAWSADHGGRRWQDLYEFIDALAWREQGVSEPPHLPRAVIVGPGYDAERDGPVLMEGEAWLVRLNVVPDPALPPTDYTGACDEVFINTHVIRNCFDELAAVRDFAGRMVFRENPYARSLLRRLLASGFCSRFCSSARPQPLMLSGMDNMLPWALHDLIRRGFQRIELVGLDMFTAPVLFRKEHLTSRLNDLRAAVTLRRHDPLSNYAFVRWMVAEGRVHPRGGSELLKTIDNEQYAGIIEQRFGTHRVGGNMPADAFASGSF